MQRQFGGTTVYVYAGTQPIAEYVGGSLTKEYIYSGARLLATMDSTTGVSYEYHDHLSQAIPGSRGRQQAGLAAWNGGTATTTYEHPDHLSIRAESDSSGNLIRSTGNFPFGEAWYETGSGSKWKFTSYERDSESGLDYADFRYYSSRLGRFMQQDPLPGDIADPESLDRYSYVVNDPVNEVDPLGLTKGLWCHFESLGGGKYRITHCWWVDYGDDEGFTRWAARTFQKLVSGAKKAACSAVPSGRVTSVGGSVGGIGGETGSVSQVVNYNTGQVSLFGSGGLQVGWYGGASLSGSMGFAWNMPQNKDYSGPFNNVSGGSSEGPGGQVSWASNGVKVASASMSGSLIPSPTGGYSRTWTSPPLNVGNISTTAGGPLPGADVMLYVLRQACK